jgi:hypothetical protein
VVASDLGDDDAGSAFAKFAVTLRGPHFQRHAIRGICDTAKHGAGSMGDRPRKPPRECHRRVRCWPAGNEVNGKAPHAEVGRTHRCAAATREEEEGSGEQREDEVKAEDERGV